GRELDEHDGALAPLAQRLDPRRRALLVEDAIILVILEIAIALQKAEPPGVAAGEAAGRHRFGIVERPPQALTTAGPDRQSIRIMNLRPPVSASRPVQLRVPEHAGQGRDTQAPD